MEADAENDELILAAFCATTTVAPCPEFTEAPPVLTAAEIQEGYRLAQEFNRQHGEPPVLVISRSTGAITRVITRPVVKAVPVVRTGARAATPRRSRSRSATARNKSPGRSTGDDDDPDAVRRERERRKKASQRARKNLWPAGFEKAEVALVRLLGRHEVRPEDALVRIVLAWRAAA
jgi:hypothetical protein